VNRRWPRGRAQARLWRLAEIDGVRTRPGLLAAGVLLDRHSRAATAGVALAAGTGATCIAGMIAGGIAAVYAAMTVRVVLARRRDNAQHRAAGEAMDGLSALAADLRAGVDPDHAAAAVLPSIRSAGPAGARTAGRIAAACRVADVTGARLADLMERLEGDTRDLARLEASARAQAAGTRATAWLLAGLPAAGIALGYGIGANPLHELLHTAVGAICAGLALLLQVAGLLWTDRLARIPQEIG